MTWRLVLAPASTHAFVRTRESARLKPQVYRAWMFVHEAVVPISPGEKKLFPMTDHRKETNYGNPSSPSGSSSGAFQES